MAAPEGQSAVPSFPPPPPFYKLYAPAAAAQQAGSAMAATPPPPPPLPPPPIQGPFQVYDRQFDLDEPLVTTAPNAMIRANQDGSIDYKAQLSELVGELVPLFLELLRALVEAPEGATGPLSRVTQALAAAQHLINMARPDQARATLEYVLQLDVQEKRDTLAALQAQIQDLDALLLRAAQAISAIEDPDDALAGPAPMLLL